MLVALVTVAVVGVALALIARGVVSRRTGSPGGGRLSWQLVCASVMLLCAAFLVYIVITEPARRYVNVGVVVALVVAAIWLLRSRTTR